MASSKKRRLSRSSSLPSNFAALDFGNKKTACLIVRNTGLETEIIGGAIQQSRGISDGAVTDMAGLERTIRIVLERAENQAEQRVDSVVVGVAGSNLKFESHDIVINTNGRAITEQDTKKLSMMAQKSLGNEKSIVLSVFCTGYKIDENVFVSNPVGMVAEKVQAHFSTILAPITMVQNLMECCRRAGLRTLKLLPASIASGMGSLMEEELSEGAVSVDIGAMSTSLALFRNYMPVWQGTIPIGGEHISRDLAHGLGTSLAAAERLKTMHGRAISSEADTQMIEVATLGAMGRLEPKMIQRDELDAFTGPRISEMVDLIRRLLFSAMHEQSWLPIRVVLSGGGSQLTGLDSLVQTRLNLPTRIGTPDNIGRLGPQFENPYIARVVGLVNLAEQPEMAGFAKKSTRGNGKREIVSKVWHWLKENL